jgi:signal transduction histidine kinase
MGNASLPTAWFSDDHAILHADSFSVLRDVSGVYSETLARWKNASSRALVSGRLTGGIAHDFNNLLHVVNMNPDRVSRVAKDEKVLGIMARAKGAVGRGAKLTGQLLSFARNQSLLPRLTDVNASLDGLHELVAVSAGPAVSVEWNLADERAWAVLDANQLEMAVPNLAVHARDAMPGGGALTIYALVACENDAGGCVDGVDTASTAKERRPYVAVTVSDTGAGIPASADPSV